MTDPTARRGPYAKGVARRAEILERSLEVFADRGLLGSSLRAIAERIGVTHAALLHYFGSREELLLEVLRSRDAHDDRLDADEPVTWFDELVRQAAYNQTVPGLISLYVAMMGEALDEANVHSRDYYRSRFEASRASFLAGIEEGQRTGAIRDDLPAPALAAILVAAMDGLQNQWLLDDAINMPDHMRTLERLLAPAP